MTMSFSVVFYTMKIVLHGYLAETSMVMNCDTDAMNAFSHPMMINATSFIDNCINIAINCFPPSHFISIVQLYSDNSQ